MTIKQDQKKMETELRIALRGYKSRYIRKGHLEDRLLENPSEFTLSKGKTYRRHLMTTAMMRLGWGPYSGRLDKAIRTYVKVK